MKRHGDLFDKIVAIDNLHMAYVSASRGKHWQNTVMNFEKNIDINLLEIQKSLINKTFTTSGYTNKTIYEPKERIIYKLPFAPDRIVQHALMNIIEPIWNNLMISDSYSCRKGKGIHAGSRKTMDYIRKVGKNGYCLKMDIRKFYPSVDHDVMYDIVRRKIKCKNTLWLLHDIIYSFDGGKNIPIGNYTSQWLGNLYMNELDQFVKHEHRVKYYIRYCDDFILLHRDKHYLKDMQAIITNFVADKLGMSLSKSDVFPISQGIDFLGYRHFHDRILLRKSTAKRIKRRIESLPGRLKHGEITLDQYRSSIASTLGWLKWANSHNFRNNLNIDMMWSELEHA
jgi:retron-type reverse transcriptase